MQLVLAVDHDSFVCREPGIDQCLTVGDLEETIATALGGEPVTTTVDGRERYTVNVRYLRGLRNDAQAIAKQVLVQAAQICLLYTSPSPRD